MATRRKMTEGVRKKAQRVARRPVVRRCKCHDEKSCASIPVDVSDPSRLVSKLDKVLEKFWDADDVSIGGSAHKVHGVMAAFAAVSEVLGKLDALSQLWGVPKQHRLHSESIHFRSGRIAMLRYHDSTCKNCPEAEQLRQDLAGN